MNVVQTYNTPGVYTVGLKVTDAQGLSDTDTVTVTVPARSDLQVTGLTTSAGAKAAKQGEKVTVTATVRNAGPGSAPASKTEFLLDGTKVLGLVDTPALAAGQSAQVSVIWDTQEGPGRPPAEGDRRQAERDRRVERGEQQRHADGQGHGQQGRRTATSSRRTPPGPAPRHGAPSGSGTSYSDSGTDGSKAASAQGTRAARPARRPGRARRSRSSRARRSTCVVSVNATGTSSPASAGVVFLGSLGQVLSTVTVLTAPLTTSGFQTLQSSVTVPLNVAKVQVVLRGFSPADLARKGTVTFDDVGLFAG